MGERVPCLRKCGGCVYSVVKKNRILNEISLLGWVSWNNNNKKDSKVFTQEAYCKHSGGHAVKENTLHDAC